MVVCEADAQDRTVGWRAWLSRFRRNLGEGVHLFARDGPGARDLRRGLARW